MDRFEVESIVCGIFFDLTREERYRSIELRPVDWVMLDERPEYGLLTVPPGCDGDGGGSGDATRPSPDMATGMQSHIVSNPALGTGAPDLQMKDIRGLGAFV